MTENREEEAMRTQIWSSGGGVQSSAIAALICMGKLRPDLGVIVDTEREMSTTWSYMEKYVQPALEKVDFTLHRIRKSEYATVDLYSTKEQKLLIPAFTDYNDSGKLPTYCSNEWKKRVMRRWATAQGVKKANIWIGFTIDELKRVYQEIGKWEPSYPLIERRMTRGDCIALVKRMGWPEPPRSSCYMCPNHTAQDWKWERENAPKDFERAIKFERYIRKADDSVYLTSGMEPLDQVEFDENGDLFDRCTSGMCFV